MPRYDIIRPVVTASLATTQGGEEMGVYRRGDKGWEVSVDTGERYVSGRKKYHRELVKTKKEALQREKELLELYQEKTQQIIQEEIGKLFAAQQPESVSFESATRDWLNTKKLEVRKTTYEGYEIIAKKHLIPYFNKTNIANISETDVRLYLAEKAEELSSTTLRHHYSTLNMILKFKNNYCMMKIKKPKLSNFEAQVINDLAELQEFVKGFEGVIAYLPVRIAAATGMRLSEIAGLQWRDIDFKNSIIRVKRSLHYVRDNQNNLYYYIDTTKTKTSIRVISVGRKLIQELAIIKEERGNQGDNDFVCVDTNGKPINRQNVYDSFKKRAIKLGYEKMRFHDLRHSHATVAIQQLKMSAKTVQRRLGHSTVNTTLNTYTANIEELDKEIGEKFDF